MAVVAFILGAFVIWRAGREAHFEEERLFDVILVSLFWGLVGARIGYLVEHWPEFGVDPLAWLSVVARPGLSLWAGVVAGVITVGVLAKRLKWDGWELADVMMPGFILALAIGWGGAFLNGAGYGVQTNLPWAVKFVGIEGNRHPTQLYLGGLLWLWFWVALRFEREYRTYEWYQVKRGEALPGFVFLAGGLGVSLMAAGVSFWQPGNWYAGGISLQGWQWLTLGVMSMIGLYGRSGRKLVEDLEAISKRLTVSQRSLRVGKRGVKTGMDVARRKI